MLIKAKQGDKVGIMKQLGQTTVVLTYDPDSPKAFVSQVDHLADYLLGSLAKSKDK